MTNRKSIPFFWLLVLITCFVMTESNSYAQKKKKSAKEVINPRPLLNTTSLQDSLIVVECKLPLVDSADDRPTFSLDGKIMVFGSRRPPMPGETWRTPQPPPFKWDGDVYYRILSDSGWSVPINPGPQINNGGDQNNPSITPRGDEIYFVSGGGGNIMRSKFIDGKFQQPLQVEGLIRNAYANLAFVQARYHDSLLMRVNNELARDSNLIDVFQRAPETKDIYFKERLIRYLKDDAGVKFFQQWNRFESAFTPDGRFCVFSENFGKRNEYGLGGEGDDDLWIANVTPNGKLDTVQTINGKVNSPYSESYPFVAADGTTIYFSSNRQCENCPPGTPPNDDIYTSHLTDSGFSKPVPLPPPINSFAGDYGFTIAADGETGYFVSNRSGKSKFYQVHLRPQDSAFAPKPVILLQGKITDKTTGNPLRAEIFIDELAENRNSFSVLSDSLSGTYILAMQRGHRFGLQVVANKYLPQSEHFTFPVHGTFDRNKLDFQLSPIEVGATTEFKNVYFDFGKATLLNESKLELNRVAEFLKKNRNASIEVDGHTDDVGTEEANNRLSLERATNVMNYLIERKIPKERMEAKGFGKTRPIKKGSDDASRALNRRVEMVITSYAQ